jgi:hypothetical protein
MDVVAAFGHGEVHGCAVFRGAAAGSCGDDSGCLDTEQCVGLTGGLGRCAPVAVSPGEGSACDVAAGCPVGSGLLCADASGSQQGLCAPAAAWGRFAGTGPYAIPEGGLALAVLAHGLRTVSTDVRLRLELEVPAGTLYGSLTNPAGTEVLFAVAQQDLVTGAWESPLFGFPGDEAANGEWTLKLDGGAADLLAAWTLELGSRWD